MQKQKHFAEIDIMRGIAIVLVIIGHSSSYSQMEMNPNWFQIMYKFIYSFHMPLFFFVSGFCFYSTYENARIWKDKWNVFLKKARRLAVPYFLYSFTTLILKTIFPQFVNNKFEIADFYRIFYGENPNGELWFLWILFAMFIIGLVVNRLNIYLLFAIALFLKIGTSMWYINNYLFYQLSVYFVFFVAGLVMYKKYEWIKKLKVKKVYSAIFLYALCFAFSQWQVKSMIMVVVGALCGIFATWIIGIWISEKKEKSKTLLMLSEYSMDIYLLSYFVQIPIRILSVQYLKLPYLLTFLSMCLFGIVVPIYISKYIIRKNKWTASILLGRTE